MAFGERLFKSKSWGDGCREWDFLLIGWWWGNQVMSLNPILLVPASVGSTCLWPGVDTILHLGVLVFGKQLKYILDCYLHPFRRTKLLWFCPLNCLSLLFGTRGRSRHLFLQTGDTEGILELGGPHRALLSFKVTWECSVWLYYQLHTQEGLFCLLIFQFSHSDMSNSLRPHGLRHARPPSPYQLLEITQTHVHWVGDAIQPSHPLLSPSPPTLNLFQLQGLF